MTLIDKFYVEEKFADVSEINVEELTCRYFKDMWVKHTFDVMGEKFKSLYLAQVAYVAKIKKEYKDKYGT